MLSLTLGNPTTPLKRLLAVGAHADDIEIGCGGTLLRLIEAQPDIEIDWVVLSGRGVRADEARRSAERWLQGAARASIVIREFEDGFFPYHGATIKRLFEELKSDLRPDLILTHYGRDGHQDHRLVSELTWNTFRDHFILEYEVPKYDADLGSPNLFVSVSDEMCGQKIARLLELFESQRERRWFTEDVFRSVLRLRGMECNSPTRYAEAFYCRKIVATL